MLCAWDRPAGVCCDHGDFVPLLFLPFSLPSVCLSVRPFVCLFLCRRFFEGVSHSGSQTEIGSLHSQKGQDQESGSPVSYTTTTTTSLSPSLPSQPSIPAVPAAPSETTAPGSTCLGLSLPFFALLFPSTGRQVAMGGILWGHSQGDARLPCGSVCSLRPGMGHWQLPCSGRSILL